MDFKVTTYRFKNYEADFGNTEKSSFGMIIPTSAIKGRIAKRFFGWYILFNKKWVGIRRYKRILPVRQDMIVDFLFWTFVKPLHNHNIRQWIRK